MIRTRFVSILALGLCATLAACGDDDNDNTSDDTGTTDTGMTDTGMADTGMTDTGEEDTGEEDTGMTDTGMTDTGEEDTGMMDTGGEDTGMMDTGGEDTGMGPMPRGADNPPTLGDRIDRMGRAAITSALVGTFGETDGDLKDAYNAADPSTWSEYAADIEFSLGILDALDATCGNQLLAGEEAVDGRYDTLAGILADDQLYVNSASGTCGVYLGLEAEIVGAVEAGVGGCGGRTLPDDVIDRSYSVLAAGLLTGVDDTITANDREFLEDFPYLAAPHGE